MFSIGNRNARILIALAMLCLLAQGLTMAGSVTAGPAAPSAQAKPTSPATTGAIVRGPEGTPLITPNPTSVTIVGDL